MKSVHCWGLLLLLLIGLVSCGSDDGTSPNPNDGYTIQATIDTVLVHDTLFGDSNMLIRYICPPSRCASISVDYSYSADSDTIFMDVMMEVESTNCSMGTPSAEREKVLVLLYNELPNTGSVVFAYEKEEGVPVYIDLFVYEPSSLTNITFDPPSPSNMQFGDFVNITFNYATPLPGVVRVWCDAPGYGGSCGSPYYDAPTGTGTECFSVYQTDHPVEVTWVDLYMYSEDHDREILRIRTPVEYTYQEW